MMISNKYTQPEQAQKLSAYVWQLLKFRLKIFKLCNLTIINNQYFFRQKRLKKGVFCLNIYYYNLIYNKYTFKKYYFVNITNSEF
jgi:hypothetical protein